MLDLATERQHLVKAEIDIAAGERRIARQAELVARLHLGGHNTVQAEALLETLRETLLSWRDHRDVIRYTIARLESETAPGRPR